MLEKLLECMDYVDYSEFSLEELYQLKEEIEDRLLKMMKYEPEIMCFLKDCLEELARRDN